MFLLEVLIVAFLLLNYLSEETEFFEAVEGAIETTKSKTGVNFEGKTRSKLKDWISNWAILRWKRSLFGFVSKWFGKGAKGSLRILTELFSDGVLRRVCRPVVWVADQDL